MLIAHNIAIIRYLVILKLFVSILMYGTSKNLGNNYLRANMAVFEGQIRGPNPSRLG